MSRIFLSIQEPHHPLARKEQRTLSKWEGEESMESALNMQPGPAPRSERRQKSSLQKVSGENEPSHRAGGDVCAHPQQESARPALVVPVTFRRGFLRPDEAPFASVLASGPESLICFQKTSRLRPAPFGKAERRSPVALLCPCDPQPARLEYLALMTSNSYQHTTAVRTYRLYKKLRYEQGSATDVLSVSMDLVVSC